MAMWEVVGSVRIDESSFVTIRTEAVSENLIDVMEEAAEAVFTIENPEIEQVIGSGFAVEPQVAAQRQQTAQIVDFGETANPNGQRSLRPRPKRQIV